MGFPVISGQVNSFFHILNALTVWVCFNFGMLFTLLMVAKHWKGTCISTRIKENEVICLVTDGRREKKQNPKKNKNGNWLSLQVESRFFLGADFFFLNMNIFRFKAKIWVHVCVREFFFPFFPLLCARHQPLPWAHLMHSCVTAKMWAIWVSHFLGEESVRLLGGAKCMALYL